MVGECRLCGVALVQIHDFLLADHSLGVSVIPLMSQQVEKSGSRWLLP